MSLQRTQRKPKVVSDKVHGQQILFLIHDSQISASLETVITIRKVIHTNRKVHWGKAVYDFRQHPALSVLDSH